ncbi:MAG: tRNA uridine-5-carboxymethylaminomethyl(34) synthesis GTPase MnmE, partial [Deltaproteobacteria bacterium]|nr:tRNA uridine-5-carboxymethylaminomethyl(34) synthesis GTPase MnmE [Deltaproteobacteria bacterium]
MNQIIKNSSKNILPEEEETIAAISTPFGESGIGIVRMSGPRAESIVRRLFKPKRDKSSFISHHFHYGEIIDPRNGHPVDEVLVVLMRGPKT